MIKGICTIERYQAYYVNGEWVRGELLETIKKTNAINWSYLFRLILGDNIPGRGTDTTFSTRIFISEFPAFDLTSQLTTSTTQWLAATFVGNSVYNSAEQYWETFGQYLPPVSTRYIRAVSVCGASRELTANRAFGATSTISLNEPCIQGTDQILSITYRLFVDTDYIFNSTNIGERILLDLAPYTLIGNGLAASNTELTGRTYYPTVVNMESMSVDKLPGIFEATIQSAWIGTNSLVRYYEEGSHIWTSAVAIPAGNPVANNGSLVKGFSFGSNPSGVGRVYRFAVGGVNKGTPSSIQNTYGRRTDNSSLRTPYLDLDNLSQSGASIAVTDDGTWADTVNEPIAQDYRIQMVDGGLVGASSYRFRRRRHSGSLTATNCPRHINIPTMNSSGTLQRTIDDKGLADPLRQRHGQTFFRSILGLHPALGGMHAVRYVWPEFLTVDLTGVTITSIRGEWENVDVNSNIPLPVTQILQVANDDTTILVACENTGLWKVERPSLGPVSAVTQITPAGITNPNSCRGVQVNKNNGDWWALFHDVTDDILYLAKSTDQGSNWTLYDETTDPQFELPDYTSGSPGPTSVIGLHLDPYHPDNRFFIRAPVAPDTNDGRGWWWSEANSSPASDAVRQTTNNGNYNSGLGWKLTGSFQIKVFDTSTWIVTSSTAATIAVLHSNIAPRWNSALVEYGSSTFNVSAFGLNNTSQRENAGIFSAIIVDDGPEDLLLASRIFPSEAGSGELVLKKPSDYNNVANYEMRVFNSSTSTTHRRVNHLIEYLGNGVFIGVDHSNGGTTPNGILFKFPYYLLCFISDGLVASDELQPWFESWGWNGSEWELGHSGSKPTHAASEPLLDGLSISFDDNDGDDDFIAGEYYDCYVYDGILADQATSFSQTSHYFLTDTTKGTDFTPSTVPLSNVGAVSNEPVTLRTSQLPTSSAIPFVGVPGRIDAWLAVGFHRAEQRLSGDFEIRFRITDSIGAAVRMGFINWVSNDTASEALRFEYNLNTIADNPTNSFNQQFWVHVNAWTATTGFLLDSTWASDNVDSLYTVERVSDVISFYRDGNLLYTYPTPVSNDLAFVFYNRAGVSGVSIRDIEVDYTVNRRYVSIGDGATTGPADVNFRKMVVNTDPTELQIQLDGMPAVIITDGYTPPGPGEVTVLQYSGRLWFNEADEGKTITGNWRYVKKINLE
jgi:hypothetical protein